MFDLNPCVLCSPHRASIESCVEILGTYLGKNHMTIRLEPLLKEVFCSGDTTPLPAKDLKKFCDKSLKSRELRLSTETSAWKTMTGFLTSSPTKDGL